MRVKFTRKCLTCNLALYRCERVSARGEAVSRLQAAGLKSSGCSLQAADSSNRKGWSESKIGLRWTVHSAIGYRGTGVVFTVRHIWVGSLTSHGLGKSRFGTHGQPTLAAQEEYRQITNSKTHAESPCSLSNSRNSSAATSPPPPRDLIVYIHPHAFS